MTAQPEFDSPEEMADALEQEGQPAGMIVPALRKAFPDHPKLRKAIRKVLKNHPGAAGDYSQQGGYNPEQGWITAGMELDIDSCLAELRTIIEGDDELRALQRACEADPTSVSAAQKYVRAALRAGRGAEAWENLDAQLRQGAENAFGKDEIADRLGLYGAEHLKDSIGVLRRRGAIDLDDGEPRAELVNGALVVRDALVLDLSYFEIDPGDHATLAKASKGVSRSLASLLNAYLDGGWTIDDGLLATPATWSVDSIDVGAGEEGSRLIGPVTAQKKLDQGLVSDLLKFLGGSHA